MRATRKRGKRRSLQALTTTVVLAIVAVLLLAGTALAAMPGKPIARTPTGTITLVKPTFKWGNTARATKYEVRAYRGSTLLVRRTGITKLSWTSSRALTKGVSLTWKVRAGNHGGNGEWSRSLKFKIETGLTVGDAYQGGRVAYILQPEDPGYDAEQTHGLIAATADQSAKIHWNNGPYGNYVTTGATGTTLGWGPFNTDRIIAAQGPVATSYAAGLARAYRGGGYADWFLPSSDELYKLYLNRSVIGGYMVWVYWSSSEVGKGVARAVRFDNRGSQINTNEDNAYSVRAVRAF